MIDVKINGGTKVDVRPGENRQVQVDAPPISGLVKGRDGYSPYINDDGTWMCWDDERRIWVDTGVKAEGAQGPKGDTGAAGPVGPKGNTGASGPAGPKGDKGDKGDQGVQGPAGQKGDTGAQGPQGTQGEKGDTGATGPAGPRGDTGPTGPAGADGYTPVRGVDYWTEDDRATLIEEVLRLYPAAEGVGF